MSRDTVLEWLSALSEGPWVELMVAACAQKSPQMNLQLKAKYPHISEDHKYIVGHVWRAESDEQWETIEVVAPEDREHYRGTPMAFSPEDCSPIRNTTCEKCGNRVTSWARVVKCPVCGEGLSCH
ncbi:hypothetical protein PX52LOC_00328 [Limnoglobus roseus]|uniref:Uncharacterized protein n=1 Tax=Limnoglobus roseus TaxID=2598579 RepID=A0A5C1A2Y7_9BACT|nr:hypothetical protein PX52LOC_00328 [Limnoglobus roseus]